jgi:CPA1 family monovalent cation:H+ antiporter
MRLIVAMSLAGVRGAITLAGILTLPLVLRDGTPFPARDLAILLAAGVIVASLLAATFLLPRLLKGLELPPEPSLQMAIDEVRAAAAQAAIQAIEAKQHDLAEGRPDADLYADAASRVMELYRRGADGKPADAHAAGLRRRIEEIERQLRIAGLRAERERIEAASRTAAIDDDAARKLIREIDFLEARYNLDTL